MVFLSTTSLSVSMLILIDQFIQPKENLNNREGQPDNTLVDKYHFTSDEKGVLLLILISKTFIEGPHILI